MKLAQKMYAEMTKYYKEGRIRAIGVCSSLPPHIQAFEDVSDVVPAVNQFEISPLNTQKKLIEFCQNKGIVVEAMSTFSHFRSITPRTEILENETIDIVAKKYGKTIAQVILRWLLQQNIVIIPKTWNPRHLEENITLYDFELNDDDMKIIDSLDKGKFLNYNPYLTWNLMQSKYRRWTGF